MSAVQDPVNIITERTMLVPSVSSGSGIMETAVSTAVSTADPLERMDLPVDFKVFRRCIRAPSDPFTGVISSTASTSFFLTRPLYIYLEMDESSTPESSAKCLSYSIERITVDQTTTLPVESLMVDVVKLEREMSYPLPTDRILFLTAHDIAVKIVCKR